MEIDGAAADGTVLDCGVGAALGLDLDGKVLPAVGALDLSVFGEIYGREGGSLAISMRAASRQRFSKA